MSFSSPFDHQVQDDVEVAYALVTACGQAFGDLLQFRVEKKEVESPICVILKVGAEFEKGRQKARDSIDIGGFP